MHPTLLKAIERAKQLLNEAGAKPDHSVEKEALLKLSKKELADLVLQFKYPAKDSNKGVIQEAVYAILSDPDCIWLDYGTIATLVRQQFPWAETKDNNVSWYSSKAIEKERDVLPRKPSKAIAALVLSEL